MAFTVTSLPVTNMRVVGEYDNFRVWVGALVAGTKAIDFGEGISRVLGAWASSQTANAARISDITGSIVTVAGTGTDTVMVLAAIDGVPRK